MWSLSVHNQSNGWLSLSLGFKLSPCLQYLPSLKSLSLTCHCKRSKAFQLDPEPPPNRTLFFSLRQTAMQQPSTRTVQVTHLSDLATEREIHEFFSFSGDIERVEIDSQVGRSRTAFVTFKDPKALEIALLLSGATIIDQIVSITPVDNYVPQYEREVSIEIHGGSSSYSDDDDNAEAAQASPTNGRVYVKAQDVVTNMIAKGSAIKQEAVNKAKAFDEKHRLTASASEKVSAFDKRVGLTEKLTVGISAVNEKVKSVDQRLQVSDKTMAAIFAAERKLTNTGSAVKTSRYVTAGTTWLNGAFTRVAKVGQVAGSKTREKFNMAVSNLTSKDPPIAV